MQFFDKSKVPFNMVWHISNQSVSSFLLPCLLILFRMHFHITLCFSVRHFVLLLGDLCFWDQGLWSTHFRDSRLSSEMGIRLVFRLRPLKWIFSQSCAFQPHPGFLSSSCFQYLNLCSMGQLFWGRVNYPFCAMTPVNNSILFC